MKPTMFSSLKTVLVIVLANFALAGCSSGPDHSEGQAIVNSKCKVCHAQGINGAPIIGNSKMWSPRIKQGKETLIDHAMSGYGLMPAKGGNEDLTREDISKAIGYMISRVEQK